MSNGATETPASATERFLTFRMDRVERDLDRLDQAIAPVPGGLVGAVESAPSSYLDTATARITAVTALQAEDANE